METEKIAEKILNYLSKNPAAGDTLEGISKWWVQAECIDEAVEKVSAAVERLVEEGLLEKQEVEGVGSFFTLCGDFSR